MESIEITDFLAIGVIFVGSIALIFMGYMLAKINTDQDHDLNYISKIAAQAPEEIPAWFEHEIINELKNLPTFNINTFLYDEDVAVSAYILKNRFWDEFDYLTNEGPKDLHDKAQETLERYITAESLYDKKRSALRIKDAQSRYFQWRIYYADQLIIHASKSL